MKSVNLTQSGSTDKMFKSAKKIMATFIVAMCMVQGMWANTATEIADIIRTASGNQLTATVSGSNVTVTGTIPATLSNADFLTFGINSGGTVIWRASLTGSPSSNFSLINITGGSGTFRIESGIIENTGNGRAITNNSASTITISGGTVSATSGMAIFNASTGVVSVSSGTVSATSGTAIRNENLFWNSPSGTVNISGGTVNTQNGFAIYSRLSSSAPDGGAVTVSGGTVSATSGVAISASFMLTITSGTVSATSGTAISATRTTAISGGTVSAITGTAFSNHGMATISGSARITSESTFFLGGAIFNDGNTLNVNGGTIENMATAGGYAINNNSGTTNVNGGIVRSINGDAVRINSSLVFSNFLNVSGGTISTTGSGRSAINTSGLGTTSTIITITGGTVSTNQSNGFAINKGGSASLRIGRNPTITGRILTSSQRLEVFTSGADAFNPESRVYMLDFPANQYNSSTIAVMNGGNFRNNFSLYNPNWTLIQAGQHLAMTQAGTNIQTPTSKNALTIYPNPAQNFVYITAGFPIRKVEIFNTSGVRVFVEENPANRIDLRGFAEGVYFVRIYGSGGVMSVQKLIVR